MSVKIIVDSTVDLTEALKNQVAAVVPLSVRFGDEEYKDGETITARKFYEMLAKSEQLPTTSQPSPTLFENAYEKATADGSQVVVITISSRLSGTYQSATIAAEDYEGKVFVVDSRSAAIGAGVLTAYALRLAQQGKSGQEILEELMHKRDRVRLYAIVDTLEYLKKGGRLNAAVAVVGGLLNIKPLICVNEEGKIDVVGTARGMKKAYSTLNQECGKHGGADKAMPVILGYTGESDENLMKYMEENREMWGDAAPFTIVGAAIGVHTGPGVVAAAFFSAE